MRPAPSRQLDPRAVSLWRLTSLVALVVPLALGSLVLVALGAVGIVPWLFPLLTFALLGIAAVAGLWVGPALRYRRWRFDVSEQEVDLQKGVLVVTRTLVPMTRVQHVDSSQGPFDRMFGLANVRVATAAGAHEIPALTVEDADALRDRISDLARVAVEDV